MSFNSRLREVRKSKFKEAKEFVAKINESLAMDREHYGDSEEYKKLAYTTYAAYEVGNREPRYALLVRMAKLLNVSTDYLLEKDTEGESKELHEAIIKNMGNLDTWMWNDEDKVYIRKEDNTLVILDTNACKDIIKQADAFRIQKIDEGLKQLLAGQPAAGGETETIKENIAKLAAADLVVDYEDFGKRFAACKKMLKGYIPSCMDALCFYYFTGVNPVLNPEEAHDLLWCYRYVYCEGLEEEKDHKKLATAWKRIINTYVPVKRLLYLEAYAASRNSIDYSKYAAKFNKGDSGFRNMQEPFFDSIYEQGGYRTLLEGPQEKYIDVVTPEMQTFIQKFGDMYKDYEDYEAAQEAARKYFENKGRQTGGAKHQETKTGKPR